MTYFFKKKRNGKGVEGALIGLRAYGAKVEAPPAGWFLPLQPSASQNALFCFCEVLCGFTGENHPASKDTLAFRNSGQCPLWTDHVKTCSITFCPSLTSSCTNTAGLNLWNICSAPPEPSSTLLAVGTRRRMRHTPCP